MKLLVVGANGFVAKEVIRQSLRIKDIDTVLALSRTITGKPSDPYPGSDLSKLRSLVVTDYDVYGEEAKAEFADVDACIWTVAITPSKSKQFPFEEVIRICYDSTIKGVNVLLEARSQNTAKPTPLRFQYMSGIAAERDQSKIPTYMPDYCLMRGRTEMKLLEIAARSESKLEVCAAKPGLIIGPKDYLKPVLAFGLRVTMGVPSINVDQVAAAMLHEVVTGFSKEPLMNEDLVQIGNAQLLKEI